ncbi:MAG: glycosyltransferase family 39 protein [Candidatus Omnitrophica bacterium]|nr:glycosyltransferase family 39 protein [Candidatus Omnitrophota bacterium]
MIKVNLYILLIFFLFFIIIFFPLVIKSQVWIDEILDAEPAYNLAFKGKLSLDVLGGRYHTDKICYIRPPVYPFVLSQFYKIFGFKRWVTLSLSLMPGIVSFSLTYIITFLFFKSIVISILSYFLFALSPLGIYIAKANRGDALALFLYILSLNLLFIYSNKKEYFYKTLLLLSCGLSFSISTQTYQLYSLLLPSFLYYFFTQSRRQSKSCFKEVSIFLLSFMIPFTLWLGLILKDFQSFKEQILYNFFVATNFNKLNSSSLFSFNIKSILSDPAYFTLLFILISVLFTTKKYPLYRNIFIGFIVLPIFILFLFNLLKGYYIQIILPLGFVAGGVFIYHIYKLVLIKNNIFSRFILYFFFLFIFFMD